MHEYSIVGALVEQVERLAREQRAIAVHRLRVRIGELSGVEIDLLESAYELFREGTVCAGAELMVEPVPASWSCPRCRRGFARGETLRCPDCGVPARLTEGDEILLQRVEMEVEETEEADEFERTEVA
jgi:hydrogenase nickel incorporation protein HypA/HybF